MQLKKLSGELDEFPKMWFLQKITKIRYIWRAIPFLESEKVGCAYPPSGFSQRVFDLFSKVKRPGNLLKFKCTVLGAFSPSFGAAEVAKKIHSC